jgi:prepilin-type N-terminal cleavage/methylation domain-containing protein
MSAYMNLYEASPELPARMRRHARRHGFSLVELAMVLGIVSLLVAGIMLFFANASDRQKVTDAITEMVAIQSTVGSLTAGQPFDETLDLNQVITQSKMLPSKWVYPAGANSFIEDPWKGFVNVSYADVVGGGGYFLTIQLFGLNPQACSAMVASDVGQYYTQTDTTVIMGTPTPADANFACSGSAEYVWFFILLNQV